MALKSGRTWTWRNFTVCYLISLGMIAMGYPAAVISTTLAQPSFLIYMGLLDLEAQPPRLTGDAEGLIGAMSGVFQAGAAINVFIASYVADKWGRKASFHYLCLLSVFGGALICGSKNVTMFIVGRFFAGAGSWGYMVITPFYTAELAPAGLRGLMVGLTGINLSVAYVLSAFMGLAFHFVKNPGAQWRGPLGLALVWPVLVSLVCFFIPESPRYLLMKGKVDEAREVVFKLHSSKDDPDQELARGEFYQMTKQTELERQLTPSYLEMIRKPSYRKRVLLTMGYAFFGQSTGVLVLNNYGPTIYKELGYDTVIQLILQCGWVTLGLIGVSLSALIMDRVGRKPLMIVGLAGCCVSLALEAAMVASFAKEGTNKAGLRMGVAAAYMFTLFYTFGFDSAGFVFFSEVYPSHLRARGLAIVIATVALTDLVYLEVTETAFANIGWKFYLVFIILSAVGTVFTYFFIPETKNIPLEEMGTIFGDDVAVYGEDLRVDHRTHELIVDGHGDRTHQLERVATEAGIDKRPSSDVSKLEGDNPSVQHVNVAETVHG
ncbi:hypothetical protein PV08_04179 [Exophiala spinifera]|uniref:Major facilitator superfamily (MFS) profile domain-containing protein n=1 Tax=Exophiala spinifera TaxID=91928 RepID=A0A0D2BDJ0_9EURO|nr:uncharacterized protein PV08_04179 [Exophiala spinifera]KIW16988.1 hypothetical protein PV08_04179 [Exophiala spinifera]